MINKVHSFAAFANRKRVKSVVFETCVTAMERGLLHVDTINANGWTLGYLFVENVVFFDKYLWDRYWALCPDVSLFWRLVHERVHLVLTISSWPTHLLREALCSTPALWADLALVQPCARKCGFIQEQVHARMRKSFRFAWIAAVVAW